MAYKTALAAMIISRKNILNFLPKFCYKNFTFLPIAFILHGCIRLAFAADEYCEGSKLSY